MTLKNKIIIDRYYLFYNFKVIFKIDNKIYKFF